MHHFYEGYWIGFEIKIIIYFPKAKNLSSPARQGGQTLSVFIKQLMGSYYMTSELYY